MWISCEQAALSRSEAGLRGAAALAGRGRGAAFSARPTLPKYFNKEIAAASSAEDVFELWEQNAAVFDHVNVVIALHRLAKLRGVLES